MGFRATSHLSPEPHSSTRSYSAGMRSLNERDAIHPTGSYLQHISSEDSLFHLLDNCQQRGDSVKQSGIVHLGNGSESVFKFSDFLSRSNFVNPPTLMTLQYLIVGLTGVTNRTRDCYAAQGGSSCPVPTARKSLFILPNL